MYFEFANVLVFVLVAFGFILGSMVMGRIVRRHRPDPEKLTTYECGEDTIGTAWVQFNVRFYVVALIFLIFDVEIAVLFPWTTVFAEAKAMGPLAFIEMSVFLVILLVGFAYVWVKGDLEWLTSLGEVKKAPGEEGR
jgi:NADH-quinone oxidoreductase subunit A